MSIIIIPCCFSVTWIYNLLKSEENNCLQDMLEDSNENELAPAGKFLIEDGSGKNVDKGSTEAADAILNVLLNSPGDFERKQPPEGFCACHAGVRTPESSPEFNSVSLRDILIFLSFNNNYDLGRLIISLVLIIIKNGF